MMMQTCNPNTWEAKAEGPRPAWATQQDLVANKQTPPYKFLLKILEKMYPFALYHMEHFI